MKKIAFIIPATLFSFSTILAQVQAPEFKLYEIGEIDELMGQTSLVDLDKDGDLDYIVGSGYGTIWWFEYKGDYQWEKHVLGKGALTDAGGVAYDVDGDGHIDQVSGQTWFHNPGDPTKEFTRYETKAIFAHDNITADVNGDGHPDLISMSENDGLFWYDHSEKPFKKWKEHEIDEGVRSGIAPFGAGDIDEDGDIDIVRSNQWYENVDGEGKKWAPRKNLELTQNQGRYPNASRVVVIDFDHDGDNDIVQVSSYFENCKLVWMEKMDVRGRNIFAHWIEEDSKQDFQSLVVADFNNDGAHDIFVGGGPHTGMLHKKCFVYMNRDTVDYDDFDKYEVLDEIESFNAVGGDVDGDGDIDIITKPWKGTKNYFLRNMYMENKEK